MIPHLVVVRVLFENGGSLFANEEASASLMELIIHEKCWVFLQTGLTAKSAIVSFSQDVLGWCVKLRRVAESCDEFAAVWSSDILESFRSFHSRLESLARCLLHLFCTSPRNDYDRPATKDADVLYFVNYAGLDLMEKQLKRLLGDGDTWWGIETKELIQKGAGSLLHEDKVADLQSMLTGDPVLSVSNLKQARETLQMIRGTTRSQRMSTVLDGFSVSRL